MVSQRHKFQQGHKKTDSRSPKLDERLSKKIFKLVMSKRSGVTHFSFRHQDHACKTVLHYQSSHSFWGNSLRLYELNSFQRGGEKIQRVPMNGKLKEYMSMIWCVCLSIPTLR